MNDTSGASVGSGCAMRGRYARESGFEPHVYERTKTIEVPRAVAWQWLSTPETFTRQVWPYRVEFVDSSGVAGASGFAPGVLNMHHGPLLHCPGVLTSVTQDLDDGRSYRDLQYFYGAFIVSPRLIRPTRLEFWLDGDESRSMITLRVSCDVTPWLSGVWTKLQSVFWNSFYAWAKRDGRRLAKRGASNDAER